MIYGAWVYCCTPVSVVSNLSTNLEKDNAGLLCSRPFSRLSTSTQKSRSIMHFSPSHRLHLIPACTSCAWLPLPMLIAKVEENLDRHTYVILAGTLPSSQVLQNNLLLRC